MIRPCRFFFIIEVAQNLEFFLDALPGRTAALGSPGAASDIGALEVDPPRVMELPAAIS